MEPHDRRTFLLGSVAAATAVLAGCGAGGDSGDGEEGRTGSGGRDRPADGTDKGGGTRTPRATGRPTIAHRYGHTRIPAQPKRVVTVGLTEQDYVLAFGIAPVGVREWFGGHPGALWPWARKKLGDRPVPEVLPTEQLNYEQIAALRPDLILGLNSGLTKLEYSRLSGIAPTVAQPKEYADYGIPWQRMAKTIATALGVADRAGPMVRDIEREFDRARDRNPAFAKATGLLATSIGGEAYIYAEGPAPRFLTSLGFELPRAAAARFSGKDRAPVKLSDERLDVLEADVLLLGVYGPAKDSVARKPTFRRLDVAREGRDITLPKESVANGALSFSSILSLPIALDQLVPRMAAAIDGDPATPVKPVS